MQSNLVTIRDRLAFYTARPDPAFRTDSGYKSEEEDVMQKLRQFWADDSIPNEVKLQGFEMDLKDFDPRDTSFREMVGIGLLLLDLGIVDSTTRSELDYGGVEFDDTGHQINKDKRFDAFAYLESNLKFLKTEIQGGHEYLRESVVKVDLAITVLLALEERAQQARSRVVDIKA